MTDPSIHIPTALRFGHSLIFFSVLLICSFIDLNLRIIPDAINLPMIALSPVVALLHPDLTMSQSLLGILLGAGIIYAVAWIYFVWKKMEGIGMGDAKLLAAIGGWLGYDSIFPTFFYASIIGSVVGIIAIAMKPSRGMQSEIPFGPFLALGAFFYFFGVAPWHLPFFAF